MTRGGVERLYVAIFFKPKALRAEFNCKGKGSFRGKTRGDTHGKCGLLASFLVDDQFDGLFV